jgi:hypothetical protein
MSRSRAFRPWLRLSAILGILVVGGDAFVQPRSLARPPPRSMARPWRADTRMAVSPFDIARARVRIESYGTYATVAALMTNASMRLMTSTTVNETKEWLDRLVQAIFITSIGISILTGTFTAVIFTLSGIYAKTALGVSMDGACKAFLDQSQVFRQRGFQAFEVSLISWSIAFPLSLFTRVHGKTRWFVLLFGLALTYAMCTQWFGVIALARELIYIPRGIQGPFKLAKA